MPHFAPFPLAPFPLGPYRSHLDHSHLRRSHLDHSHLAAAWPTWTDGLVLAQEKTEKKFTLERGTPDGYQYVRADRPGHCPCYVVAGHRTLWRTTAYCGGPRRATAVPTAADSFARSDPTGQRLVLWGYSTYSPYSGVL